MSSSSLSSYVEGAAAKYLSAVDADPERSNQHEFGGLVAAGFDDFLGRPVEGAKNGFKGRFVYITDDESAPTVCLAELTWYDARFNKQATRSAEYRLYYESNDVSALIREGDFLLIAKLKDGTLLLVFAPRESSIEFQLCALFGVESVTPRFTPTKIGADELVLPLRVLLEELGIQPDSPGDDRVDLERILVRFGVVGFPTTKSFSAYAREILGSDTDANEDPDAAILAWMDCEERLFRILERHHVRARLAEGFTDDVDSFIRYSLTVQNRRKSRVGHAFEGHLETIFNLNDLQFERGGGSTHVTEHGSTPDFLFPGFSQYRSDAFPPERLMLLGAKTTCKDRWRQVLAEGDRVKRKHLITLEAAISEQQTEQMRRNQLQLVVPSAIHSTYRTTQRQWLCSLKQFIEEVRANDLATRN